MISRPKSGRFFVAEYNRHVIPRYGRFLSIFGCGKENADGDVAFSHWSDLFNAGCVIKAGYKAWNKRGIKITKACYKRGKKVQ